MDYKRKNRLKFKISARFYDGGVSGLLRFSGRGNPVETMVSLIPEKPLHILDVCTGTATPALAVSLARPQSEILGIDISPEMIAVAKKKLKRKKARNLRIVNMDATKMDFRDDKFDAVMVSFGLHEFPDPLLASVLEEMVRVLKPGGALYMADYDKNKSTGKWSRFVFWLYLKVFEPKHMPRFLSIDWPDALDNYGLTVSESRQCFFSTVVVATKNSGNRGV